MPFTNEQLHALESALARGERRVSFGDKTVEYRSVEELKTAIREVQRALATQAARPNKRQIRITTHKGL